MLQGLYDPLPPLLLGSQLAWFSCFSGYHQWQQRHSVGHLQIALTTGGELGPRRFLGITSFLVGNLLKQMSDSDCIVAKHHPVSPVLETEHFISR